MEPTITLSLDEYNSLIEENKKLKEGYIKVTRYQYGIVGGMNTYLMPQEVIKEIEDNNIKTINELYNKINTIRGFSILEFIKYKRTGEWQ